MNYKLAVGFVLFCFVFVLSFPRSEICFISMSCVFLTHGCGTCVTSLVRLLFSISCYLPVSGSSWSVVCSLEDWRLRKQTWT